MKPFYLLFLLALAAPAFAATCASQVSPSSMTFNVPSYGPTGPAQAFTLTPAGGTTWSISVGGADVTMRSGTNTSSGSGNTTVYAYVQSGYQVGVSTISDSATFLFGGVDSCVVNFTINILARNTPTLSNNAGVADSALAGSSSSGGWIVPNDLIPPSSLLSLPGAAASVLPAQGSSYLEPVYGTRITNCSPGGYVTNYSTNTALNADSTYMFVQGAGAAAHLINRQTCADVAITGLSTTAKGNLYEWLPDGTNNTLVYIPNVTGANTIRKAVVTLSTGVVSSDTVLFTRAGATSIDMGSTDNPTPDGWLSFWDNTPSHPNACLINLLTATAYCRDMTLDVGWSPAQSPNFTLASLGCDPRTGKRYMIVGAPGGAGSNYGPLYSVVCAGGTLTFEGMMPVEPEMNRVPADPAMSYTSGACTAGFQSTDVCLYTGQHSAMAESVDHHQYWLSSSFPTIINHPTVIMYDLGIPLATMATAVAGGGGASWALPLLSRNDAGISCKTGYCIVENTPTPLPSWGVVAPGCVTSGSNINCTLSSAPGTDLQTGDPIDMNGVGGCTNANGIRIGTGIVVSGTLLTIPSVNCNSAWTSGGRVHRNAYPASSTYRYEAIALKIGGAGQVTEVHRIGSTMSTAYLGGETYYSGSNQCNLSNDHQWVVCNSNWGSEGIGNVHVSFMPTGLPLAASNSLTGKDTATGFVLIQ